MITKNLIGALYARVSTDSQLDGFSIMAQLTELTEYCNKNEIKIYDKYVDEGISGTKEDRFGMQKMLNDSKNFDIVLVHKFDRFARKVELSEKIKRQLKSNNVKVISITEPIEDSPIGFFQEGLLSLLSEYYIKNLSTEVKKGMLQRVKEGHYNGSVPYGYYNKDKKLYINNDESEIVKHIYDLYLDGYSSNMIAEWARKNNILTQNKKVFRSTTVTKILHNIKYIGKLKYEGKIYNGIHKAIIDEDVYNKVQQIHSIKQVNKNYTNNKRGKNYLKYYLIEVLYCGECGSNFRANATGPSRSKFATYGCCQGTQYQGLCTFTKGFNIKKFESEFEDILKDISLENIKVPINKATPKSSTIEMLKQRNNNITKELTRNKQAYLEGVFTLQEFKDIKADLETEKKEIENKLSYPTHQKVNQTEFIKSLKNILREFPKINNASEKRNLLKKVIDRVYIFENGDIEIVSS